MSYQWFVIDYDRLFNLLALLSTLLAFIDGNGNQMCFLHVLLVDGDSICICLLLIIKYLAVYLLDTGGIQCIYRRDNTVLLLFKTLQYSDV